MVRQQNTASTLGVVIPTIGQRSELKEMLASILAQTRPVDSIQIVVDAADTSLVDEIVAGVSDSQATTVIEVSSTGTERGEGVYLVETGYGYAVNQGLARLDTDLVAFLDDDDVIRPSHFDQLEAALDPSTGRGVSYSRVMVVSPTTGATHLFPKGTMPQGKIGAGVLIDAHPVLLPACLIHRSVLDEVGPLDQSLDWLADTDMVVRLGIATNIAAVDDPTYVYHRVSRKALMNERVLGERARLFQKHQTYLTKRERLLFWDTQARSSLRSGLTAFAEEAAEQLISTLWARPPRFLISWYLTLRRQQTPQWIKRLVQKVVGPISGKVP